MMQGGAMRNRATRFYVSALPHDAARRINAASALPHDASRRIHGIRRIFS